MLMTPSSEHVVLCRFVNSDFARSTLPDRGGVPDVVNPFLFSSIHKQLKQQWFPPQANDKETSPPSWFPQQIATGSLRLGAK